MAFDFPSSPTTGQTYSVSGGPTYVYNGTAWVVLTPGNQFNRTVFTATAGQTTFTMNYVVGAIDVYRNGVKLVNTSDFTATNGTSIVLLNAATAGDTVEVISYPMITYSDAVKRTGDTMTGALTISNNQFTVGMTDTSLSRINLNNTNRSWSISNYGSQVSPNGSFNIADETATAVRLGITTSGAVYTPNQPCFMAHANGGWVAFGDNYVIAPTSIDFNVGSCYNSGNGRFTAPVTGYYYFLGVAYMQGGTNGRITLFKNGSQVTLSHKNNASDQTVLTSGLIYMTANDYVDFRNSLYTLNIYLGYAHTYFAGYFLG